MKRIREINKELDLLLKRVMENQKVFYSFEIKIKVKTYNEIVDFLYFIVHIDTNKKPKFFMEDFYKSHNKVLNVDSFLGNKRESLRVIASELGITIEEVILYVLKNARL